MSEPQNTEAKFKRKRKKSFLKNARKYAKKGCFGRGSQLEADTYQYFVQIMETFKKEFDTEEEKVILVNNVFEQTVGEEINCSCNQVGSRVIEQLLPWANDQVLERFFKAFGDELRPLCADRFASHVLEALIEQSAKDSKLQSFGTKVGRFLLNNLEDYLWDTYGSHVIQKCVVVLSKSTEEDLTSIVSEYAERVLHWPQFPDLCQSDITSSFLQKLLEALKTTNKKLMKKMLAKVKEQDLLSSKAGVRLLETALAVADSKRFTQLYITFFLGKLPDLAINRETNFSVQKLIQNCKEKTEFEAIFDELKDKFGEILSAKHTGVIWALAQSCKDLGVKQGPFLQSLIQALGGQNDDVNLIALCKLQEVKNAVEVDYQKEKFNLHGTLIVQITLEFNKPIKVINSILNMEPKDLCGLFSNPMGSHIVDSFVKSSYVGEKSREKLVRKLGGSYRSLAGSKYGSRSFEALWQAATLKNKVLIMDEIAHRDASWASSNFGKIIASKVNLNLFKRNKEEWKSSLNVTNKAEKIFEGILK